MSLQGKDLGALVGQLGADTQQWDRAFDRMDKNMRAMENRANTTAQRIGQAFDRASKRIGAVGQTLTRRVTLPIIGAAGASLKMAGDFDQSMRKITGLVGIASDKVDGMRDSVLQLAGDTARSPQELADAMFFVTSAGLRGAEAMEVLEASAKASAAGLGDTATVADLVTSAVNAYGPEVLSAANATDILVGAVREGKAEAPQLAASMGQVLPIASNMGVSFDQVGAAIAAMTRTGTEASQATVQLRQILASLLKPTNQAEEALAEMGTSSAELRQTVREDGLLSVLGFLKDQMETNEQAMAQVFPNIRALSGALDLMGSSAGETSEIFNRMQQTTGLNEQAFEAAQGPAFRFQQALSKLRTAAIRLGTTMFPIFEQMIDKITPLLDKINGLEESTLKWGVAIAGVTALVGPLLIVLSKLIKTMGVLFTVIFSKVSLIIGAITGLLVAWQWVADNWAATGKDMELVMDWIHMGALRMARDIVRAVAWMIETIINMTPAGMLSNLFGVDQGANVTESLGFTEGLEIMDKEIEEKTDSIISRLGEIEFVSFGESAKNALDTGKDLIISGLQGILESDQIQEIIAKIESMFETEVSGPNTEAITESIESSIPDTEIAMREYSDIYRRAASRIAGSMTQILGTVDVTTSEIEESTEETADNLGRISDQMEAQIIGAIGDMTEEFFGGLADLAFGAGQMEDIWNGLLTVIADLAIRVGKIAIGTGVAIEGIKKALESLNPVAAIAAGVALVALGSAVKSALSSASQTASGGSSASGGSFTPTARSEPASGDQEVVFRIGNKELVGVLQQGNKNAGRVGRRVDVSR